MSQPTLAGRTVLVTGATRGIGLETARQLGRMGARVVLGVRDPARGASVAREIAGAGGEAEVLAIDLASFASVRSAAARFSDTHAGLDVLVNNAGIIAAARRLSADGHELTWATNFLGGFLLTRLLVPALRQTASPRVVNVSSVGHAAGRLDWSDLELERDYRSLRAYANSKLALVLFTRELARREPGVTASSVHPGLNATRIWRGVPEALTRLGEIVLPPARGAGPVVRLASGPGLDGPSGRYFHRYREASPSPAGANDADAARLWEIAEHATGLAARSAALSYDRRP